MTRYRISFYNDLQNDYGHISRCSQRSIEIRSAKSKDRAIEAAKRRFARQERIRNWALHAQAFAVEELPSSDTP